MANFIDRIIGFFSGSNETETMQKEIEALKVQNETLKNETQQLNLNGRSGRLVFPNPFSFGYDFGARPETGIMAILDECRSVLGKSTNPYNWIKFSDAVFSYLPFYQLAVTKRAEFIGNVVLRNQELLSDSAKQAAQNFIDKVPMLFEQPQPKELTIGLDSIAKNIVINAQRVGCGIIEERYNENGEFVGVMKYNPRNFMYQLNGDNQELVYYGYPVESNSLRVIALEYEDGYLWGKPLIYGGHWAVENLTAIIEAYKNGSMRVANPATLTTIGMNDTSIFETQIIEGKEVLSSAGQVYMDTIQAMNKLSARNLARMNDGKSAHSIVSIPGEINVNTHSFGEGVNGNLDKDLITIFAIILAANIGVPASMLELFLSGNSSLNKNDAEKILQYLDPWINDTRTTIKPYLLNLVKNELRRQNFAPKEIDLIDIDFEFSFAVSESEKLDRARVQSEIDERVVKVWSELAMINPDAAAQYLRNNGFEI